MTASRAGTAVNPPKNPDDEATTSRGDTRAFDRRLLIPMILGSLLNPVNSTLISVALVPIGVGLGASASQTALLVTALYLATAVGQPVTGRFVDLLGPRRPYLVGTTLVGVGGVIGAVAPNIWVLVVARVIIGLGTCAGYPAAMSLVRGEADRTGEESPAGVLTILSLSTQTVAVLGPTLGGVLVGVAGWRSTFAINVPMALIALIGGWWIIPRPEVRRRTGMRTVFSDLDPRGIALFSVTMIALLVWLEHVAWWPVALVVVVGAALLVRVERHATRPFIDVRLLAGNRPLVLSYVRALLTATVSYLVLYGYPQWLEQGRHLSPSTTGLALVPIFVTGIGVTALTGRREHVRRKLLVGSSAQLVVGGLLVLLTPTSAWWLLGAVALVAGLPQGLNNLAVQNAVYHQADPERVASSSGLLRTFFYTGAILAGTSSGTAFGHGPTPGLHLLGGVIAVVSLALLVLTLADRSLSRLA